MRITSGGHLFLVFAIALPACRARQQEARQQQAQPAVKADEEPLTAVARYRAQADKDDPEAQYRLAVYYADGRVVARDDDEALRYLQRAAEKGHAGAQYRLALAYDDGRGVPRDRAEAYRLYRQAAEHGEPRAQYKLGLIHDKESGSRRDTKEATKWYREAAQHGHAAAASQLLALARPQPQEPRVAAPGFAIARPPKPAIADLERRERATASAHAALIRRFDDARGGLDGAWKGYAEAERTLTDAREAAWLSIPFTRRLPVVISDPLTLAMLDLQIELRHRAGAIQHTVVPALKADPGCRGDLVQGRLIYKYGAAAADLQNAGSSGAEAVEGALDAIARQLACLSILQLAEVEAAVSSGFDATRVRMKDRGLDGLTPAFARLVAPVQLLILDTRKHRGERSPSWRWFRSFRDTLKRAVGATGWASNGNVYLWDRRGALLIGFPPCPAGPLKPDCIDLRKFLDSLSDPRAVGLGDCALAGMITKGVDKIAGQDRYTCPSLPCTPDPDPQRDRQAIEDLRGKAAEAWPSTPPKDIVPDRAGASSRICRPLDSLAMQTAQDILDDCIAEAFNQAPNPWDTYAGCTAEAVTPGQPPEAVASLPGVPMGKGCGAFSEGGGASPAPAPAPSSAGAEPPPPPESPPPPTTEVKRNPDNSVEVKLKSGGSILIDKDGSAQIRLNTRQDVREAVDSLTDASLGRLKDQQGGQVKITEENYRAALDALREEQKKARDCVDPLNCADSCTGLGAQIAAVNQCTDDLLNTLAGALGRRRGSPEPPGGRPPGIVSIWDPENAPVDEGKSSACVTGGDTGPAKEANACGLVHCPGVAGGLSDVGGNCCGSVNTAVLEQKMKQVGCYSWYCPPGQPQGPNCECLPGEATQGQPSGSPPPIDRSGRPGP
jgi:hypothetical protein